MQTIFYANTRFETDDAVAVAVLDYAERLSADGSCAVVRVPTVSHGMPAISRLLVGAGLPLAVQVGTSVDDPLDGYAVHIDPFEVRRTLHEINERMHLLDQRVVAHPFSPESGTDESWDLDLESPIGGWTAGAATGSSAERPAEAGTDDPATVTTRSAVLTTSGNVTRITTSPAAHPADALAETDTRETLEESGDSEL
jgi:hypothetical protein